MEAKAFGLIDEVLGDTSDIVVVGNRGFEVSWLPSPVQQIPAATPKES
jgi:hypothetical protein